MITTVNENHCAFQVGSIVSNADIVNEFKCGNMGGLRRSIATNSLIVISDHTIIMGDSQFE